MKLKGRLILLPTFFQNYAIMCAKMAYLTLSFELMGYPVHNHTVASFPIYQDQE